MDQATNQIKHQTNINATILPSEPCIYISSSSQDSISEMPRSASDPQRRRRRHRNRSRKSKKELELRKFVLVKSASVGWFASPLSWERSQLDELGVSISFSDCCMTYPHFPCSPTVIESLGHSVHSIRRIHPWKRAGLFTCFLQSAIDCIRHESVRFQLVKPSLQLCIGRTKVHNLPCRLLFHDRCTSVPLLACLDDEWRWSVAKRLHLEAADDPDPYSAALLIAIAQGMAKSVVQDDDTQRIFRVSSYGQAPTILSRF